MLKEIDHHAYRQGRAGNQQTKHRQPFLPLFRLLSLQSFHPLNHVLLKFPHLPL
jgi:hypothetical protein